MFASQVRSEKEKSLIARPVSLYIYIEVIPVMRLSIPPKLQCRYQDQSGPR